MYKVWEWTRDDGDVLITTFLTIEEAFEFADKLNCELDQDDEHEYWVE